MNYISKCLPVPPRIVGFTFGDEPLEAGSHSSLQCLADQGDTPLSITWVYNTESKKYIAKDI